MGRARAIPPLAALLATLALTGMLAGCGGQTFTASEFVDRINSEGVSIELGNKLAAGGNAKEIYAITLPPAPGEPVPRGSAGHGVSGSLYVFGDTGGAENELAACRQSGGLLCYRAANIVILLDETGASLEARRLALAISRLRR